MIDWFVKLLKSFWTRDPRDVTDEFRAFARKNADAVYDMSGLPAEADTVDKLLIAYIRETGMSPFMGDINGEEQRKFLAEYGL